MSDNIEDNEVQIGPRKIGPNTVVQVNLKTLVIVLGFLGSGLWYVWSAYRALALYGRSPYPKDLVWVILPCS